jgi:hypothetical protein
MKVFTSSEVARILMVAPRTVTKWIDKGLLKGYRLPGSLDRRVPYFSLVRFLRRERMLWELLFHRRGVAVISNNPKLVDAIKRQLDLHCPGTVCSEGNSTFDAGTLMTDKSHQVLVIDDSIGWKNAQLIRKQMQSSYDGIARSIVITNESRACINSTRFTFMEEDVFTLPVDPELVAARVCTVVQSFCRN